MSPIRHGNGTAQETLDVTHHRPVPRDASGNENRLLHPLPGRDRIHDIAGQSQAKAVANFLQTIAGLLRMAEIRLGKDRAPGGDLRNRAPVLQSPFRKLGASG